MTTTVTKTTMDAYRIHAAGEYACITIQEWQVEHPAVVIGDKTHPAHTQYCGEILINSSFGSFNSQWTACGTRFRRFLLGLNRDYFMGRCLGMAADVYDGEGSVNDLVSDILQARRRRSLDKIEMRDLYDAINDVRRQAEHSPEGFVTAISGIDFYSMNHSHTSGTPWSQDRFNDIREEFLSEAWHHTREKPNPQCVGFWRDIWPVFCDTIKKELAPTAETVDA